MRRDSLAVGTLILALAAVVSRFLGIAYRIVLPRLIGAEGIGLFQMAYQTYTLALILSTAGVPLAISKLVAEKVAQGRGRDAIEVFRLSLAILCLVGFGVSLGLILGAGWISVNVNRDPRAYYSIVAMAPAVFFASVSSAYRGFFQGLQNMTPTANSEILEQLVRVGVMLLFTPLLIPLGVQYAAAMANFGSVVGGLASVATLVWILRRSRDDIILLADSPAANRDTVLSALQRLLSFSVPVTLTALIFPMMGMVDLVLVPMRLSGTGIPRGEITALYGELSGMATPVVNLPSILTGSLAFALVPAVSEAYGLGDLASLRRKVDVAVKLCMIVAVPSTIGVYMLAPEISQLLYANERAGDPLRVMAPAILFLAVHQISSAVLQGMGQTLIPFLAILAGALCKFAMTWSLLPVQAVGIKGAALGTVFGFLISAGVNMAAVNVSGAGRFDFIQMVGKTVLASTLMAFGVVFGKSAILDMTGRDGLATVGSIIIGATTYCVALCLVGGVRVSDIHAVPRVGPLIARLVRRPRK